MLCETGSESGSEALGVRGRRVEIRAVGLGHWARRPVQRPLVVERTVRDPGVVRGRVRPAVEATPGKRVQPSLARATAWWLWFWARLGLMALVIGGLTLIFAQCMEVCQAYRSAHLARECADAVTELARAEDAEQYAERYDKVVANLARYAASEGERCAAEK